MSSVEEKVWEIYALHPKGKEFGPEQTYVGKTCCGLEKRLSIHKSDSTRRNSKVNRFIREFGIGNMEMELIERCLDPLEAVRVESYWAEVLEAGLNEVKPGSMILAGGKKEYKRKWQKENAESHRESTREWARRNSEVSKRKYYAEWERNKALQRYRYALRVGKQPDPVDVPLPPPDAEGL